MSVYPGMALWLYGVPDVHSWSGVWSAYSHMMAPGAPILECEEKNQEGEGDRRVEPYIVRHSPRVSLPPGFPPRLGALLLLEQNVAKSRAAGQMTAMRPGASAFRRGTYPNRAAPQYTARRP